MSLPPQPGFVNGREELLAELDARLTVGHETGPRVVALYGLAGAGKTSVALEYAYRHLAEVGVAWYFRAEDTTVLVAGFSELAAQLGAREVVDARDPVKSVHAVLAAYPADWLLIFHNAPDRETMGPFLPPAGRGRVVITSGYPFWSPGQALEVPTLGSDAAVAFLLRRTGGSDQEAARELTAELGGLPLALERAAAYIQASGDSLGGYLSLFRRRRAEMLARGAPTGDKKTVTTVWTLAFEDLQQRAPSAVGLLRLLAYCAPEAIPLRLLLQPRSGLGDQFGPEVAPVLVPLLDEVVARDAIAALRQYSLVIHAGDGLVSAHRLVQAVTADQMPTELAGQWRRAAAALVEAAIPQDGTQPDTWPDFAALLPHAQAALTADNDGMARIAIYLGYSGGYAAARDLQRRVVDARVRVLGPEDPGTLTARNDLAFWTGTAGDPAGARDQVAALLPVCERVLGPEHPGTLTARNDLARWTGEAGDPAGARDQSAALLPIVEGACGSDHPQTADARLNLARWTGEAGDAVGARDQFAMLLSLRERVSGPEHPHTLSARVHLAIWAGTAGDLAGARDQVAALLPVCERVLGPEHPDTLWARANLARWTGQLGDAAGARDQFAALLPVTERVLGPEHPETQAAREKLAYWADKADGDVSRDVK